MSFRQGDNGPVDDECTINNWHIIVRSVEICETDDLVDCLQSINIQILEAFESAGCIRTS